jgi:AbrB family looped-hinge helix DNA binding protein
MRVTAKGQVTIPRHVREKLGITPQCEVEFVEEGERVFLVKKSDPRRPPGRFAHLRGAATVRMTTEEIMTLTRGEE